MSVKLQVQIVLQHTYAAVWFEPSGHDQYAIWDADRRAYITPWVGSIQQAWLAALNRLPRSVFPVSRPGTERPE